MQSPDTPPRAPEHLERNRSLYTAQAADEAAEAAFASDQRTKVRRVAEILGSLTPHRVVAEFGSFTGYAAQTYAAVPGVDRMVCFDLSEAAVERCRARGLGAHVWNADQPPAPAQTGVFDVVLALDVVEHLVNTMGFLVELKRVCAPNGHLVMSTPNLAFWLNRVRLLLGRVPWGYPGVSSQTKLDPAVDLNHLRLGTLSEWRHLLATAGWRIVDVQRYSLLDDQPRSPKNNLLRAADRLLRRKLDLAFGHIYIAEPL